MNSASFVENRKALDRASEYKPRKKSTFKAVRKT